MLRGWAVSQRATLPLRDVHIDVPVAPSKLIAVGLNYADHIAEMKRTPLGTPLIWFKAPTSLLPHEGTIEIAFPEHQTHFEVELGVVIGKRGKNVASERRSIMFSATRLAKTSAIAICRRRRNNSRRAKSFDTYTPVGPFIYTDVDVSDLPITLRQNGEVKQQARTSQMIYPVAEIVSFASQGMTLLPGDLILTGTPSGVGPIADGDTLEATIGEWPALRNRVAVAGE